VIRQFHVIEAAMWTGAAHFSHSVLKKIRGVSKPGFKMRFTQQRSLVAIRLKVMRNGGLILWESDAVHPDTVGGDVLAGDDCGSRRHANHILIVSAGIVDPSCS
jgi:hypothetical protein